MKNRLIVGIIVVFGIIHGQEEILCGTPNDISPILYQNRTDITFPSEVTIYCSIHLFEPSAREDPPDFLTPITIEDSENILFEVNSKLEETGISIVWEYGEPVTGNLEYYQFPSSNFCDIANIDPHENAIDVYLGPIGTSNQPSRSFSIPSTAMLVLRSAIDTYDEIFIHELGHCLGLYHTHHGTSSEGSASCDGASGDGGCPEHINGDNCLTCGDYICDTPADPNLEGMVSQNCIYTVLDNFNPDVSNYMSYSLPQCYSDFSDQQIDKMMETLKYNDQINPITISWLELANKSKDEDERLDGYLSFDNLLSDEIDYPTVFSGSFINVELEMFENAIFPSSNLYKSISYDQMINNLFHIYWDNNQSDYKLVRDEFQITDSHLSEGVIAKFSEKVEVDIVLPQFTQISLKDPWFVDDIDILAQLNSYRIIDSETIHVFQNRISDEGSPVYSIQSDIIQKTGNQYLIFKEWRAFDTNNSNITSTNIFTDGFESNETQIVFNENVSSIEMLVKTVTVLGSVGEIIWDGVNIEISAPELDIRNNGIYQFEEWVGQGVDFGNGLNEPTNQLNTTLIISDDNASIEAIYSSYPINQTSGTVISVSYELTIPPSSNYSLAPGVKFVVSQGGHLEINGTPDNPVVFQSANLDQNQLFDGIEIESGGMVTLNNFVLNGATKGLYAQTDAIFQMNVSNCTFANMETGIEWDISFMDEEVTIQNSAFYNCDTPIKDVTASAGGGYAMTFVNYNRYDSEPYGLNLDITNDDLEDFRFVDAPNNNFQLRFDSPCVDEGDPNTPDDPDGSQKDIGAYYYSVPVADMEINGNIGEHPNIAWDLTVADPVAHSHSQVWRYYSSLEDDGRLIADNLNSNYYRDEDFVIAAIEDDRREVIGEPGQEEMLTRVNYRVKLVDHLNHESLPSNEDYVYVEMGNSPLKESEYNPSILPAAYALFEASPNPFNPITHIRFDLPERSRVSLIIYDMMGREINRLIESDLNAGYVNSSWDATDGSGRRVASGVYLYTFIAHSLESDKTYSNTGKMILIK